MFILQDERIRTTVVQEVRLLSSRRKARGWLLDQHH